MPHNLSIVLVMPEIPTNTGSIGRLCLATNSTLHLVDPLGFEINDARVKRAGLDYWEYIRWEYFPDLDSYCKEFVQNERFHLLTTKSSRSYTSRKFLKGDYLIFGSETTGIDEPFLKKNWDNTCTIKMDNQNIRSLKLAMSVGIVLYEALRQVG